MVNENFSKMAQFISVILLSSILVLIGCNWAIETGLGWSILPVNLTAFVWLAVMLGAFVIGKNKIGSLFLCGFFIFATTFYYSALNQTPARDISAFTGFPKEYIPHYTIVLMMFIVSIALAVISFWIKNKKISGDKLFLLVAAGITILLLSILTVSSIMDYVDLNSLGVDERFTILIYTSCLINCVSLALLAKRYKT